MTTYQSYGIARATLPDRLVFCSVKITQTVTEIAILYVYSMGILRIFVTSALLNFDLHLASEKDVPLTTSL